MITVAFMMFAVSLLLNWTAFRRWYGWTDALSDVRGKVKVQ